MEIKSRPCPFTYIMRRYIRIAGPFYSSNQTQRASTPERLQEHYIRYINTETTYDCWIPDLLEVEAMAPSKTGPPQQPTCCQNAFQHHHPLWCIQIRGHGTALMVPASPSKCPRCQTCLRQTLEINLKGFPWPQQPDQVFATE